MKPIEKRLLKIFNRLATPERDMLLAFAEFLQSRSQENAGNEIVSEPLNLPRPEQESVVGAIKRLTANYPMLDSRRLLDETSMLMSQHVLQGRDAVEVIDELEMVFRRHYEQHTGKESATEDNP